MPLIKLLFIPSSLALCVFLGACATPKEGGVAESHGDSVRNMIAQQTYVPEDEVPSGDGKKSRTVLKTYREDVAEPKKVEQRVIQIELD